MTAVAEDRTFDPLEPEGAAELYRRMEAAEARRVLRADLEGHVGLTPRELYEVGCTVEPLDAVGVGEAIVSRCGVIAGAVLAGALGALGLAFVAGALGLLGARLDPADLLLANGGLAFVLADGGLALMGHSVRSLRRLAADRRRTGPDAVRRPSSDPHGRATVATVHGPGVLRVQLLWLRSDGRAPRYVEVRTLAERRIEEADAGRAEDAVAQLSETALRADRAHALRHHAGFAALGVRARPRRRGDRLAMPAPPPPPVDVGRDVGPEWRPEPLTDEGQAELARRLVTAEVERWDASTLQPLLVASVADAQRPPARQPATTTENPEDEHHRVVLWVSIGTALFALLSTGAILVELALLAVAVAGIAVTVGPRLSANRQRGARLMRAVRSTATRPPQALEEGVPGAAGMFAVTRSRRRTDARSRIALVHVRPALADGRPGDLEVRALATRRPADDDLDALGTFCAIADEAQHQVHAVGRATRTVRALTARLGRVPARAGDFRLREEPLAWAAALPILGLVALSVVTPTWFDGSNRVFAVAALLIAAYLLAGAARRVRDPFAL